MRRCVVVEDEDGGEFAKKLTDLLQDIAEKPYRQLFGIQYAPVRGIAGHPYFTALVIFWET